MVDLLFLRCERDLSSYTPTQPFSSLCLAWLFATIWGIRDESGELTSFGTIMGLQPTCSPGVCLSAFPAGDTSDAPLEDYPLAGFCCDPLYWGAIL